MNTILITGSTGAIGKQILKSFANTEASFILLVRNPKKILNQLSWANKDFLNRITIISGDLTALKLGLSQNDYQIALNSDVIIHAGGTMDIQLDDLTAKNMFATGAESMIELAKLIHQRQGLKHFIHIVGYMSPFNESNSETTEDVWKSKRFKQNDNAYERYKFLADLYVRQQALKNGFPLSVINPSTVVGGQETGETEQVGGLGHLVNMSRRKLMPFVPGGKKYWLPMVSDVVLGDAIAYLAQANNVKNNTYSFTPNKMNSINMTQLTRLISTELQVFKPKLKISIPIIKVALHLGLAKLFRIPTGSINFVSKKSFDNYETTKLLEKIDIHEIFDEKLLPNIVSDLDYRLTYSYQSHLIKFERKVSHQTIYFSKRGYGTPWIIVHGLFSDAVDFTSLALEIHKKTGNPVYVIDLPGLGHSPALTEDSTIESYVSQIEKIINNIGGPINFVGHSVGANLAAKVAEKNIGLVSKLILLQPLTRKVNSGWHIKAITEHSKILKKILRHMSRKFINKYLTKSGSFIDGEAKVQRHFSQRMYESLSSPRILSTNANLMALITHQSSKINWYTLPSKTFILWGKADKIYLPPEQEIYSVIYLPYGHQFPIAEALETSELLVNF